MATFVGVASVGGFAAAGRDLGISAPSVTRMISDLEAELGARLFHRTTRSLQLTPAGARYLDDCRRILSDIEEAGRQVAGLHGEPSGKVSITGSGMFGRLVLTPFLYELMDVFPKLSISTFFVDRVVHMLDEGYDVAVRIAHLPDSSLAATKVGTVRRVVCASPDYIFAHGLPLEPDELDQHACINVTALSSAGVWDFKKGRQSFSKAVHARLQVNTADAAIVAAVEGRGITRVLSYMIADHVRTGALKVVLQDYEVQPVPVHVMHKEIGQTSARVRATVDHLVTKLRQSPALDHQDP
jgi:DNA-binding transcriptional LysR family regulator